MYKISYIFLVLCLLSISASTIEAQDTTGISKEEWEKERAGLDYSESYKDFPAPESKKRERRHYDFRGIMVILFFLLATGIIIALVIWLVKSRFVLNEKVTPRTYDHSHPELEKHVMSINLDVLLKKALECEDFRSAIRITYLLLIKTLHENNSIKWTADKTNGDFLAEISDAILKAHTTQMTLAYEIAWFGKSTIHQHHFDSYEQLFHSIQLKLKENEES